MKINNVIKTLTISDTLLTAADGFIAPIFSIFIVQSIPDGNVQVAGTAVAIYWFVKSVVRLPIGWYLDKIKGERDDFYSMIGGYVVFTLSFFAFLLAKTPMHIYIIEVLLGIGAAFAYTPWYGFFTRHIDKSAENFEWSVSLLLVGLGVAGAGYVAGYVAENYAFWPLFVIGGVFSVVGTALLFMLKKDIKIRGRHEDGDYRIELLDRTGLPLL